MGHAHLGVIDDRGQRVQYLPIAADQHRITDRCRIDRDIAQDAIEPFDTLMIQPEPPHPGPALGAQSIALGLGQIQRGAVIDRRFAHVQLFLALEIQFHRRLERLVKPLAGAQFIRRRRIAVQPR